MKPLINILRQSLSAMGCRSGLTSPGDHLPSVFFLRYISIPLALLGVASTLLSVHGSPGQPLESLSVAAYAVPGECDYLRHLGVETRYQRNEKGQMSCVSDDRLVGSDYRNRLRYRASGQNDQVREMRLQLQLGTRQSRAAINELLRFGQSLALPLLGHTLPVEVGKYLHEGHVGYWEYPHLQLYIERTHHAYHNPSDHTPPQNPVQEGHQADQYLEQIDLVFRKRPN